MSKRGRKSKSENWIKRQPQADVTPKFAAKKRVPTPAFCFHELLDKKYTYKFLAIESLKSFTDQLRVLSSLDWAQIESSPRTTNGYEEIARKFIKTEIPAAVPDEAKILCFRFGSGKHEGRMLGYRLGKRFVLLFVDCDFTLYDHK